MSDASNTTAAKSTDVKPEEGVRILCNLLDAKAADVRIGMPVRLCWEKLFEDINYPAFEPA